MDILASQVGGALKSHGMMLAMAESCTGGVAQAITEVAGSSVWFARGFVTYSNLPKQQLLRVGEAMLVQQKQQRVYSHRIVLLKIGTATNNPTRTIRLARPLK